MYQEINALHKQNRIRFAIYRRNRLRDNPELFKRMVFSDECKFSLSGFVQFVNKQKCQVCRLKRPNEFFQVPTTDPWLLAGAPYRKQK